MKNIAGLEEFSANKIDFGRTAETTLVVWLTLALTAEGPVVCLDAPHAECVTPNF